MEQNSLPADADSAAALAERGLRYGLVDTADRDAFAAWLQADARGFHDPRPSEARLDAELRGLAYRRTTGVWDEAGPATPVPIATVSSWPATLTVSPGRTLDGWAISSVTVAATHRRRGIARALLEGELRTAVAAGMPLAMLTVTEATIYGRYGFSPAALAADLVVDRRRVHWTGPTPPGRVRYVEPAELAEIALDVTARAALRTPGEVDRWPGSVDRMLGLVEPDSEASRGIRAARYDAADGTPQGFAVTRVEHRPGADARLEVVQLTAATDDAERALWRFLVEHDGIGDIRAGLRSIQESLPWMLEDPRGVRVERVADHLWLRILDPVRTLTARRYSAPGELLLAIRDSGGFADGTYRLEVTGDGDANVGPVEPSWDSDRPTLRLGVRELGSILLGGVRPSLLHEAGRVEANSPGVLLLADRMFAAARMPHLSFWF